MTENKNVLVEVKDIKKEFVTAKTFWKADEDRPRGGQRQSDDL